MTGFPRMTGFPLIDLPWTDVLVSVTMDGSSPAERVEPVTLALAKKAIRFGTTTEDDLIEGWIAAARTIFEEQTGRQIVDATWEYGLDAAPVHRSIQLPRPPLVSVVSITYDDANGDAQTFSADNYIVKGSSLDGQTFDPYCPPGRVVLAKGVSWPATNGEPGSFRIRRVCGYGATAAAIPALVQSVHYLLVGHFHRNRSEVFEPGRGGVVRLPLGAQPLMEAFKYTALLTEHPRGVRCR